MAIFINSREGVSFWQHFRDRQHETSVLFSIGIWLVSVNRETYFGTGGMASCEDG